MRSNQPASATGSDIVSEVEAITVGLVDYMKDMQTESGRREPRGSRPPTPPDVRFRIRRFTLKIETFVIDPAVTLDLVDQRMTSGMLRAYVMNLHSATSLGRCRRSSRPAFPPVRALSVPSLGSCASSIEARLNSAFCAEPSRPGPRRLFSPQLGGSIASILVLAC